MSKNRKIKPVSFNLLDPDEVELLKHAEQVNPLTGKERNFSKYVRKLIEDDMRRSTNGNSNTNNGMAINENLPIINEDDDYSLDVKDAMNSFL